MLGKITRVHPEVLSRAKAYRLLQPYRAARQPYEAKELVVLANKL